MSENREPSGRTAGAEAFDLERLRTEIRAGLGRAEPVGGPGGFPAELRAASLRRMERHADIAAGVPELPRFRGPLRVLARLLARCVLHISRFLTSRQRECNYAVLSALRNLHDGLARLEEAQERQRRELRAELERLIEQRLGEPGRKAA